MNMSKSLKAILVLLIFILFSPFILKSQDSLHVKYMNNFGIGLFFSPDYTSSHVAMGAQVYSNPTDPKISVKPGFGYTAGINLIYFIKKGWAVQTCFSYSKWQYKALWNFDYINNPDFNIISEHFIFKYYSIPISLRYTFYLKKYSLFLYTGISINKTKKAISEDIYYNHKTGSLMNSTYDITSSEGTKYAHIGGMGVSVKLKKNIEIYLNPELRTMRREHAFSEFRRLHSLGINIGISYIF